MRQFYQARYPAVGEERWLPSRFDNAVVGMAERFNELAPVYQFSSLLNLVPTASPGSRFEQVMGALMAHSSVAVLHSIVAREQFWQRVRTRELMAWELLHQSIIGVMAYGATRAHATVYDRTKVIDLLSGSVNDSAGADLRSLAINDYQRNLLACNAGEPTPWYFYTEVQQDEV